MTETYNVFEYILFHLTSVAVTFEINEKRKDEIEEPILSCFYIVPLPV